MPRSGTKRLKAHSPTSAPAARAATAQAHDEFFNAEHDGILYGLFNCECLCDPANLEAMLRDTPDEA